MKIVPYEPWHMGDMKLQEAQQYAAPWLTPDVAEACAGPYSFTGIHDGRVIGCAGVLQVWSGRWTAWACLSPCGPWLFLEIHRATRRLLSMVDFRRIEATVDVGFVAGHRWVRSLGFELEAERMRGYLPNGGDCALYAKVR